MPNVKFLPEATKKHLFKLITDTAYRSSVSSASYNLGGTGSPGKPVKKYGWEKRLPSGTEHRGVRWPGDPGRYRLASCVMSGSLSWYQMSHVGENSYKFEPISGIPACPDCRGEGDYLCPDCKGTGRIVNRNMSSPCTKCANINPLKRGVIVCKCGAKSVANGVSVDTDFSHW